MLSGIEPKSRGAIVDTTLDLTAEIIDVRDIIDRFEKIESEMFVDDIRETGEPEKLHSILEELKGDGGDARWRGDWYPVTLIQNKYFKDYVRDLLDDCDVIPKDLPNYVAIDWETTAQNILVDYTPIEIDGLTYWYR